MPDRWGPAGPPEEAYGRVTDPDRFAPLLAHADRVVAVLAAAYDVTVADTTLRGASRAVLLTPRAGAPLAVGHADHFVVVGIGHWSQGPVPPCTCDACDEDADSAIAMLDEIVEQVVRGEYAEALTRHPPALTSWRGSGRSWSRLTRAEAARLAAIAPPGEVRWPPWPRRAD